MNKKLFWILFSLILIAAFAVRIIPPQNHNFFFTIDQADDAVWVREIVSRHEIIFRGPQTNIPGIYAGPLWYYWLAGAYSLFAGDPFGAVVFGILRSVALLGVLMWFFRKRIGEWQALTAGLFLSFFWWFYDASRWSFNPFPMITSVFVTLLLLTKFLEGKKKYYLWTTLPIFFNFSFEVAAATSLLLYYLTLGAWFWLKKKISFKVFVVSLVLPSIFVIYLISRLATIFFQKRAESGLTGNPTAYFAGTNFPFMTHRFLEMLSWAIIPYHLWISLVVVSILLILFFKYSRNKFVANFVLLSGLLALVSWFFFSTNRGWYDWHTIFIPPVFFVSVLLIVLSFPKKISMLLLVAIIFFQFPIFKERYLQYLAPQAGPGILATQLKVVDWIYANRDGNGFNAYTYMPARRDYPYQYLFWWYGKRQYGFVPCEYSIYPHGLKLYVPHKDDYSKPTLGCDRLTFLIIEHDHDKDKSAFEQWYALSSADTKLLATVHIDGVEIQKRQFKTKEEKAAEEKK